MQTCVHLGGPSVTLPKGATLQEQLNWGGGAQEGRCPGRCLWSLSSSLQLFSHQWARPWVFSLQFGSALDTKGPPSPALVVAVDGQGSVCETQ